MPTYTVYKGSESGKIVKGETTRELKGDAVLVKVTASGLCGTDEHYKKQDMALGHEGAGVVEDVGPGVTYLKKGDRVGWGYEHNSCGNCEYCLTGREQYCPDREMYGMHNLDQGSFASHGVWREAFLFRIPDEITDAEAAPLMCGGATVFNALTSANVKPTDRVAIMGVGGLGHLAIQFASKMGCDVVVLSGTDSKKDEALKLGARDFIAMKGKDSIDVGRKIDVLVITTSVMPGKFISPNHRKVTDEVNRMEGCDPSISTDRFYPPSHRVGGRLYIPPEPSHPGRSHRAWYCCVCSGCSTSNVGFRCIAQHEAHHHEVPPERERYRRSHGYFA